MPTSSRDRVVSKAALVALADVHRPMEPGPAAEIRTGKPLWRRILSSLLVAAILGGWFLYLRPQILGGPAAYVMVSGASMEPTFHTGDLVIVRRTPPELGRVAAYKIPEGETGEGLVVIHRVIGGSDAKGWILQGDNNAEPDMWRPKTSDFLGEQMLVVPKAAGILPFLRSPLAVALAAALAAFLVIVLQKDEPTAT